MKKTVIKLLEVLAMLAIMVLPTVLMPQIAMAQEIVDGNIALDENFMHSRQVKAFYDDTNNIHWVFHNEGAVIYYNTSANDGATWSAATSTGITDLHATLPYCQFSVYYDGTYGHIAWASSADNHVHYRMFTPTAAGAISWVAAIQDIGDIRYYPMIAVDANGYPWIIGYDTVSFVTVMKSSTKDGTWTMEFDTGIDFGGLHMWASLVPLTAVDSTHAKMLALMNWSTADTLHAKRWTGSAWGTDVSTVSNVVTEGAWSADAINDVTYIAFRGTGGNITYCKYDYASPGAFQDETSLPMSGTGPTLYVDSDTNDINIIAGDESSEHLQIKRYVAAEAVWTDVVTVVDESFIDKMGVLCTTHAYNEHRHTTSSKQMIYYTAGTTGLILKAKLLGEPFVVTTGNATAIGATFATLNGSIDSLSFGPAIERGFYINPNIASLTGATNVGIHDHGSFSTGSFYEVKSNLNPLSIYYFCAYASNAYGTVYGAFESFTTLEASVTEPVTAKAYMDIRVTGNCTEDFAYLPLSTTTVSHSDLIAGGWINSAATDTQLTILHNGFLPYTPVSNRLAFLLTDFKAKQTETLRYYLGTEDLQTDFDVIVGYAGNISVADAGAGAIEPGNTFQFTIKGIFDTSVGNETKYIFYKKDAIRLYVSAANSLTATIGNDAAPTRSITATDISSGDHKVVVSSDATNFYIYVDDVLKMGNATASVGNNTYDWGYMGNNSLVSMEYFKESVSGTPQIWWQPQAYISGTILPDRLAHFSGTITWGTNPSCISVLPFGGIASNSIPPDAGNATTGTMWGAPEARLTGWFGGCGNVSAQPFYATFLSAANDMGMPVCSLYLLVMLSCASAIGLGTLVFTGSIMISVISTTLVMAAAANTSVVPFWTAFTFAILAISIIYLSRQT